MHIYAFDVSYVHSDSYVKTINSLLITRISEVVSFKPIPEIFQAQRVLIVVFLGILTTHSVQCLITLLKLSLFSVNDNVCFLAPGRRFSFSL